MIKPGVYPASVTPLDAEGNPDHPGLARLLAWFEAKGCTGAVIAGTNGEGPSLSAVEKRDLIRVAAQSKGNLDVILGVATSSLDEAIWLSNQSFKAGAVAGLVMPPSYFREATEEGLALWFLRLMDSTDLPILVYNLPQRTGITISPSLLERLAEHPRMAGVKDSSGERANISGYAKALNASGSKVLLIGNETLLLEALDAGWSGTISGSANALAMWLSQIVAEYPVRRESAEVKFKLVVRAIEALRSSAQPAINKGLLHGIGVLPTPNVRLPLLNADPGDVSVTRAKLESIVGPLS